MDTNTVSNVGWMARGWTYWEIRVTIAPQPLKKRRMCQHLKRAVARRALIRDDQNPLPLPVKGSMPECIAWAGIAAAILRKESEGGLENEKGSLRRCLASYIPSRNHFQAPLTCGRIGNESPHNHRSSSSRATFSWHRVTIIKNKRCF